VDRTGHSTSQRIHREVLFRSVRFRRRHGFGDDAVEGDDEDDIPLADLLKRMQENYGLTADMVDDYVNCDTDVPTKCENNEMNQVHDDVVAEFITVNGDADNDDFDDDADDMQEPTITMQEVMVCMA